MKDYYRGASAFPKLHALIVDMHSITDPEHWTVIAPAGLRRLATPSRSAGFIDPRPVCGSSILRKVCSVSQSIQALQLDTTIQLHLNAIKIIAQMPCLRQLTLIIDTAFDNLPQPHDLSGVGFAVLQEIELIFVPSYDPQISDPCSHTAAFLQLISSRAIKRLEICHTDTAPSQHTLSALLKAISQFSDSLEMCSLKIRSSGPTRMAARFVLFSQPSLR